MVSLAGCRIVAHPWEECEPADETGMVDLISRWFGVSKGLRDQARAFDFVTNSRGIDLSEFEFEESSMEFVEMTGQNFSSFSYFLFIYFAYWYCTVVLIS